MDNDRGGLNYYNTISIPPLTELLNQLGTWQVASFAADGAEFQSPRPAPATTITGVYDVHVDADGAEHQSLVPVGGTTAAASHRIEGTISESVQFFSDWLVIYRDGVKLTGDNHSSNFPMTYSNKTWWIIDNDATPGPHVYTARVERMYGEQGAWSESYGIASPSSDPLPETLSARLMLTDAALLLDVQSLTPSKDGSSVAAMGLAAELTVGGKRVALLPAVSDANGLVSFNADWNALAAAHPGATLTVSAHTGPSDSIEVLDKHTLTSLLGQTNKWVSMTSAGEMQRSSIHRIAACIFMAMRTSTPFLSRIITNCWI
jgi:hypothetical protein